MKHNLILAVLCGLVTLSLEAAEQPLGKEARLSGTFVWTNKPKETHDLTGQLTAAGTNEWKAVWNFQWNKKPMTFLGVVSGDLRNGKVTGTGKTTEGKERKFLFEGIAKDGVIEFQHFETTGPRKPTGDGKMRLMN